MKKTHVKTDDEVVVLAGADKGKRGKVIQVLRNEDRVIVEGIRVQKKHEKKSQLNPQGAIVEREGPIHISNVMLAEKYDAKHGGAEAPAEEAPAEEAVAENAEG
ncbi:MAG: 50S ribosomal protein L24 [Verrucomicrobiales bacterium]|nr:50S ribosomal protein L24 [Verrucomicrobiales bacterium]|tara:strand:+ start:2835 stop:3146 length:312 start_codon:yes stop_codon:yes gene_type:complete